MGDRENHPTECLFHLLPVLKSLAAGGITRYSGRIRSSLNVDVSESNNQFHLVVFFLSFSNFMVKIVNILNILKKSKGTASTIDRSVGTQKLVHISISNFDLICRDTYAWKDWFTSTYHHKMRE